MTSSGSLALGHKRSAAEEIANQFPLARPIKAFNHIFVMQEPAAQGSVITTSLAIYNSAFKASQFGYASAQAMLLFLVILFLTFVQTRVFGDRVFYG